MKLPRFVGRVGGMLVEPRTTLSSVLTGGPGGLLDLALLLLLQVVAVHLPRLAGSVWFMVEVSYSAGISSVLNTVAQSVLYPIGAVFVGTIVASLVARQSASRAIGPRSEAGPPPRARSRGERNVDLVALAAVPAVCLDLILTLVSAATGWHPGPSAALAALLAGASWFIVLLVVAILLVRGRKEAEE